MVTNVQGGRQLDSGELQLISVSSDINNVVGAAATKLVKPAGKSVLVLHVESGNFRLRLGQHDGANSTDTLAFASPTTTNTNNTGSTLFTGGEKIAIAAPNICTVVGDTSGAILTYWFQ